MNMYYQQREGFLDDFWSYGVARVTVYWVRNYPMMEAEWVKGWTSQELRNGQWTL